MEKILFTPDGEEKAIELYVIEQTRLGGVNYILVTDTEDEEEEGQAYILKDLSKEDDTDAVYEFVSDDDELDAVAQVFENLLEDVDLVQDDVNPDEE